MSDSCDPMDCSLPGSSVHGVFQARLLGVGCHFFLRRFLCIDFISFQRYYIHWLALVIFWQCLWGFLFFFFFFFCLWGFLCRRSCHLVTRRVLLLFQSRFLLFLLWLLWLGLRKLCWIVLVKVGTLSCYWF